MAATHLDIGLRCIKYLLCAVNSLFALTGIMIISVGTTIYAVYEDFSHFLDPSYFSPATVLIVVGFLVFIIAFLGCCGALKESTCMVLVFAVSLSIVLVLEIAAAIAAFSLQDGIKDLLSEKISAIMHKYETNKEAAGAMDFLQSRMDKRPETLLSTSFTPQLVPAEKSDYTEQEVKNPNLVLDYNRHLHCCGYTGPENWDGILTESRVPHSCWVPGESTVTGIQTYATGCIDRLSLVVHRSALYVGTGAVAIALIQLTGIMFACMLGRAIRRQKTERERRRWELRESIVNGYQPLGKADPFTTFPVVYMSSSDNLLKTA